MEEEKTTISISKQSKVLLDNKRTHPRETYEDIIIRLLGDVK